MIARCRDCGAVGKEDMTDIMPGVCPACFTKRIAPCFDQARSLSELIVLLIEAGCHPGRTGAFVLTSERRN